MIHLMQHGRHHAGRDGKHVVPLQWPYDHLHHTLLGEFQSSNVVPFDLGTAVQNLARNHLNLDISPNAKSIQQSRQSAFATQYLLQPAVIPAWDRSS